MQQHHNDELLNDELLNDELANDEWLKCRECSYWIKNPPLVLEHQCNWCYFGWQRCAWCSIRIRDVKSYWWSHHHRPFVVFSNGIEAWTCATCLDYYNAGGQLFDMTHWWCTQPNTISLLRKALMTKILPIDLRLLQVADKIAMFTSYPCPSRLIHRRSNKMTETIDYDRVFRQFPSPRGAVRLHLEGLWRRAAGCVHQKSEARCVHSNETWIRGQPATLCSYRSTLTDCPSIQSVCLEVLEHRFTNSANRHVHSRTANQFFFLQVDISWLSLNSINFSWGAETLFFPTTRTNTWIRGQPAIVFSQVDIRWIFVEFDSHFWSAETWIFQQPKKTCEFADSLSFGFLMSSLFDGISFKHKYIKNCNFKHTLNHYRNLCFILNIRWNLEA